ncbi:hypothetical protein INR49_019178 [Caranx melampygus]|nr:hypothetical protein INR49_019178 [Caranx melampygus]
MTWCPVSFHQMGRCWPPPLTTPGSLYGTTTRPPSCWNWATSSLPFAHFAGGANDRWVRSVSFCPDGRHIASITDDRTRDGGVHFWECPRSSASLQHLCRMALRRVMTTQQVEALAIPTPLRDYLTYKVI